MFFKIFIFTLFVITPLALPSVASANVTPLDQICSEYSNRPIEERPAVCREDAETRLDGEDAATDNRVIATLARVIEVMMYGIGVASVIAVIVGGILYALSAGDAQKAVRARNTIIYAIIGLMVAVLSQIIIYFVLDRL